MRKVKPASKRPKPTKDVTANQVATDPSATDSLSRQAARPQLPVLISRAEQIVDHINEQYRNQFRLQYDGRTIAVEMLALESQVVLSSVKPLRPQLVEEFTRVSMFFGYLAQVMNDDDWSDDERDAYETYETWGRIVHGEAGLIV